MASTLRRLRRLFTWLAARSVFGIGLAWCWPSTVVAAVPGDWTALSSPIFRSVGEVAGTSVMTISEDHAGFLWVGGQSGLSRWDGYRFHSYSADPRVAGSIADINVNVLHTDRRGQLWIGTSTGGLARYDPARDAFVSYRTGDGLSGNTVSALADDGSEGLWVGTNGGLDHRDARTGKFAHLRHDRADPNSLPDNAIHAVVCDETGTLWVGTAAGLARLDARTRRFLRVTLPSVDGQQPIPTAMTEDSAGRVWVGTKHNGAYIIERGQRTAHAVLTRSAADTGSLGAASIETISEVRPGEMWLGTSDHGIADLNLATGTLRWLQSDPAIATSLPQNYVTSIYRDRSGLVWVGMLSGLRRTDLSQTAITSVVAESNRSSGIADSDVMSVFAAANDRVWLGFANRGVDIVHPTYGRVGSVRPDRRSPGRTLPDVSIHAIGGFAGGPMFIGTSGGVYQTDERGNALRRLRTPGVATINVGALVAIDSTLWIATKSSGIWRLDRGASIARHLERTGLSSSEITAIVPAPHGHLWVGTASGLDLLDIASGRAQLISDDSPHSAHVGGAFIASLLTDARGRLWVGTFGRGIQIMDHLESSGRARFTQISERDGLPNVNVDSMVADSEGRIWVATDDGIATVDPRSLAIRVLHRADGVEFSNYYLGARARLGNGDILFGSTAGLTIVRPSLVHEWRYNPPIVITDLRTGGHPVPGVAPNGTAGPIDVLPSANSFAVEFAALDFSAPEQNQYAYRLDGFDPTWNVTDASRRLAAYTNLAPGSYTLELRGSNRNGVWGTTLTVPVHVVPAWNQTIGFRVFEALAALALLAAFVQARTAILRRRERELQQQVDARTAQLRAVANELRQREMELEQIAYLDPLTNLPNRRKFSDDFTRLMELADGTQKCSAALLLIDLDRFKGINDTLGHDAGDALLVEVARRLRSIVRSTDCVARLGGDEFAILLEGEHSLAEIDRICERIVNGCAQPIIFQSLSLNTSASIGIAIAPEHGRTKDALYKSADTALYDAKRNGRSTWRRYAETNA